VTFELPGESGEGLVYLVRHQTTRWDSIMTYVDSVSGDVPTCQIAIDSKWHETTLLSALSVYSYNTEGSTVDAH